MSDPADFLKFLIQEDLYDIPEPQQGANTQMSPDADRAKEEGTPAPANPEVTKPASPIHEILILFSHPSGKEMPSADLTYLGKILGAIGLSVEKVDFRNVAHENSAFAGYKYVLVFAPDHGLSLDAPVETYTFSMEAGTRLLLADQLDQIAASTELRKKLWEALKGEFMS